MSLFNNLKREIKNKKIYFILISIFILAYSLAIYVKIITMDEKVIMNLVSTLDGQTGMAGDMACIFIYTPIIFLGVNSYIASSEKESLIIKMKNRKNIFISNVIFIISLSLIISLIMIVIGYGIGGIYAGGFEHLWPSNHPIYALPEFKNLDVITILKSIPIYMVMFKTFIMKVLGFCVIGFLILILKSLINNSGILGIIIMVIIFMDVNFANGALFTKKFSLTILTWINPSSFLLNIMYLSFLLTALYLIGREIYQNKDFMSKGY